MQKYKKQTKLNKVSNTRPIDNTQYIKYASVFIFFTIFIIIIISTISHSTVPQTTNPKQQNKEYVIITNQLSSSKETIKQTMAETTSTKDFTTPQIYLELFKGLIKFYALKIYKPKIPNFKNVFYEFIQKEYPIALMGISTSDRIINEIEKEFDSIIDLERLTTDKEYTRDKFYNILFLYFRFLRIAHTPFESEELGYYYLSEGVGQNTPLEIKFIYQQYYFSNMIRILSKILNKFYLFLMEEIRIFLDNEISVKLFGMVYKLLKRQKENVFVENKNSLKLDEQNKLEDLEYILTRIEEYRKFLILNYYIVFLILFDVDFNAEVTGYRKDAFKEIRESIVEVKKRSGKRFDSEYPFKIIVRCQFIFNSIEKTAENKSDAFYSDFQNVTYHCKNMLYQLFDLEV